MWRTAVLGAANLALSALGTLALRMPGFDLTPIGIVMIAQGGEGIVMGALVLTATYMITRPSRFAWIWLQFPVAVLIGYIAIWTHNAYIPILVFHAISVLAGLVTRTFGGRYVLYTFINLGINLFGARIYGMVS